MLEFPQLLLILDPVLIELAPSILAANFGASLEKKPTLMVASKIDVANPEKLKKLKQWATRKKLKLYSISAVTGEGIEKLKYAMAEGVDKVRKALAASDEPRISKSSA